MRVTNNMIFNSLSGDMSKANERLLKIYEMVSSGKKVNKPSDDPVAITNIMGYKKIISGIEQHKRNIQFARGYLNSGEASLSNVTDKLLRLKELALGQATDTSTMQTRNITAYEVGEIYKDLISVGNTKIGDKYLFSGYISNKQPFDSNGNYSGDSNEASLKIGDGTTVLAQAHKITHNTGVAATTTVISAGSGYFKFKIGTAATYSIDLTASTTLTNLKDAINNLNAGVTASIRQDTVSSLYYLDLTSKTLGSAGQITIVQDDTSLDTAVNAFSTTLQSAVDASNAYFTYGLAGDKTFNDPTKFVTLVLGNSVGRGTIKVTTGSNNPVTLPIDATSIVIDSSNNQIVFNDGADHTISLTTGTYTASRLSAEIKSKMEASNINSDAYTVSFDPATGKFSIKNNSGNTNNITLKWSNAASTAAKVLGFDAVDTVGITPGNSDTGDFIAGLRIDSTNNKIVFMEGATQRTAVLTSGTYTPTTLAAEIKTQLESQDAGADTYTITYSNGKFTIQYNGGGDNSIITFKWSDANSTARYVLGFDAIDSSTIASAGSDTSDFIGGMLMDASPELIRDTINAPMSKWYDATEAIGTGILTIKAGTANPVTITVDSTNNTVAGLKEAINALGAGIEVRIATDTTTGKQRLLFRPETTATPISIDVSDNDGNNTDVSGLSALVYNSTISNLTTTAVGIEAFVINDSAGKRLLFSPKISGTSFTINVDDTNNGAYTDTQDKDTGGLSRLYHNSSVDTNLNSSVSIFTIIDHLNNSLKGNDTYGIQTGVFLLDGAMDQILNVSAKIGARQTRLDSQEDVIDNFSIEAQTMISGMEDADITQVATNLARQQTTLQALQIAAAKAFELSIFNFIR